MATETTKTDKSEDTGTTPEAEDKPTAAVASEPEAPAAADDHASDDDLADDDRVIVTEQPTGLRSSGLGAGAAAVVSAALGLSSLTGTSLSEMLRERKQLIGQIESSAQPPSGGGGGGDQISALYGAPWHASALFNGIFALLAVVVGGVLLALVANRAETRSWVKSVALGGVILGVIGLLIAGGMYFDLFASPPKVPGQPS
ncbi:hypothetical protein [Streptomyces albidus (ex Kaewkla and Franco 2022)]|uniref:GHMP family kinase ATP-binding protein n=1 Tax=Streptomyces albidus (ex Kaewkla and Franco 2022) TaxID=722709 RepID=UPI0015EEFCA8|nr:hypothetical protein [Streptomyces albidus (ex Kaewkla and Franco 2022)]